MARPFTGDQLVIASHNQGKVREINDLLQPFGVAAISAGDLGLPEPEETGATFIDNALIKSRTAAVLSGIPALADDSGLSVTALGGDPGIYSARWAGPDKDFSQAMAKVEAELQGQTDRSGAFICALALSWPEGDKETHDEVFEGKVCGNLVWPPQGEKGFGYDPIFIADGYTNTFGEMEPSAKHAISHRADAFGQLVNACFSGRKDLHPR